MSYSFNSLFLEVEVHPSKVKDFEEKYLEKTGESASYQEGFQAQSNKWGTECRIYFNAPEETVKKLEENYNISKASRGYRDEYDYRINSQELFWNLIEKGYRLGSNR
jgi:protein subunit release factor B